MGLFSSRSRHTRASPNGGGVPSEDLKATPPGDQNLSVNGSGGTATAADHNDKPKPPVVPPGPRASATSELRNDLQRVYSHRPSREQFAEEAIKLIAKRSGINAAALMGYEQRNSRVYLLATTGLEPDAIEILRGDSTTLNWDIPLRSVRNRRINVIEAAHENPFVPKALAAVSPRRLTIAALPLYQANVPVGVVILFSPTPRGFADALLKTLSQALRICALALSELRPASVRADLKSDDDATAQPNLLRGLAALKAELARLTEALEEAERQRAAEAAERITAQSFLKAAQERSAELERQLAELREEHSRIPQLEERIAHLTAQLHSAGEATDAAQALVKQLQAALAESEKRADQGAGAIEDLTAARDELQTRLTGALDVTRERTEAVTALQNRVADLTTRAAKAEELQAALATAEGSLAETNGELTRVRETLQAANDEWAKAETALREARSALEVTQAERESLAAQLSETTARVEQFTAEQPVLAELSEKLRTAEVERARLERQVEELDSTLVAKNEIARRLEARIEEQDQLSTRLIAERGDLQTRIEKLTAGEQTLEQERQASITAAQQRVTEVEAQLSELSAALKSTRTKAGEGIDSARREAEEALATLRHELEKTSRERDALRETLACAQKDGNSLQRSVADMSAERTRLEAALDELTTERAALMAEIDAAAAKTTELHHLHEEAVARIATLESELRAVRDDQLADVATRLTAAEQARQAAESALQAEQESHTAEVVNLGDQLTTLAEENERLTRAIEEKDLLLQSAEQGLTTLDLAGADGDTEESMLTIDRSCAPEYDRSADVEVEADYAEEVANDEIVLFDGDEIGADAARQLAEFGHRVTALLPEPETVGQLAERPVSCAVINLAIPSSWPTLRRLRNGSGSPRVPLVAYALAANAPKGFWLGPVDFAILPADQCDLPTLLSRMVPRVKRVLAMSNDIDVMSDVRTQLAEARISTAVVLDGRQALDLVPTIRPEAAVLHLSPSCVDVFRAIAGLRTAEISRDIPILFLLDSEAQPREEAFLTAGVRMLSGRGSLEPSELVDSLASALDAHRSAE